LRDPDAIAPALERLLEEFTSLTLGNLGAGRAESYRGPVLFAPDAFLDLFVAPVLGAVSAIAVQRGRSPLGTRKGQRIAAPLLSIADEPHALDLSGAGSFDREGQPTARTPIVEAGVLAGWLYNGYAAAVEAVRSTGHARGGARSLPGLGPHAVVVAPGADGTRADLRRTLGRGLSVQRFSGTVDPASGDFSGVAKSSRWVEGGRVARPVRETLISGNAFELLERIVALSSASERVGGAARAPWALVDGLTVTAG
jgi:PmbA protein